MSAPVLITKEKILLVEGKDEENFFAGLLKKLQIDGVQIIGVGGKEKFKTDYPAFVKQSGFTSVHTIGFVRDAEDKPAADAFTSICSIMKVNTPYIPIPKKIGVVKQCVSYKTGIYIMPDCSNPGMLENLCINSVNDEELYREADKYVCKAENLYKRKPLTNKKFNKPKAEVQTYLSGIVPIRNNLGLAALQNVWDYSNNAFHGINAFIKKLFVDQ